MLRICAATLVALVLVPVEFHAVSPRSMSMVLPVGPTMSWESPCSTSNQYTLSSPWRQVPEVEQDGAAARSDRPMRRRLMVVRLPGGRRGGGGRWAARIVVERSVSRVPGAGQFPVLRATVTGGLPGAAGCSPPRGGAAHPGPAGVTLEA